VMPRFVDVALADTEAWLLVAEGEIDSAREVLEQTLAEQPHSLTLLVRQAAAELRADEIGAAAKKLDGALAEPVPEDPSHEEPNLSSSARIEAWVLRALLERAGGERKASADALEHALALAEIEPYRDAFLLHGPAVRELLEHQAHIGTAHPALVEVLLDAMAER